MNKFSYLVIIITSSVFLTYIFGYSSVDYQSPKYVKMAHKITDKVGRKLKVEKNLKLVGTGGGMMGDIQAMHMSFHYYQEVDIKTARELLVYVIDEYLTAINSDENLRCYLHNYPFTTQNIEIRIWFYKPNRTKHDLDKIYYISAIDGVVNYYLKVPPHSRIALHTETFEEAQLAVQLQKNH